MRLLCVLRGGGSDIAIAGSGFIGDTLRFVLHDEMKERFSTNAHNSLRKQTTILKGQT